MSEHGVGEAFATALAASMAFLGVLGAALKFWKRPAAVQPPEIGDFKMLASRITEMERRQGEADRRMDDVFDLLTDAQKALAECQTNTREALTRLDERRTKR